MAKLFGGAVRAGLAAALLAAPVWANPPGDDDGDGAGAQEPQTGGGEKHPLLGEEFIERLSKQLELSADQQAKAKALIAKARPDLERRHAEVKALRDKMKAASKEMQKGMRQVREDLRQGMTLEQRERFDEMWMSMKMRGRGGMRERGGMGPGRRRQGGRGEGADGEDGDGVMIERHERRRRMGGPELWGEPEGEGPQRPRSGGPGRGGD